MSGCLPFTELVIADPELKNRAESMFLLEPGCFQTATLLEAGIDCAPLKRIQVGFGQDAVTLQQLLNLRETNRRNTNDDTDDPDAHPSPGQLPSGSLYMFIKQTSGSLTIN